MLSYASQLPTEDPDEDYMEEDGGNVKIRGGGGGTSINDDDYDEDDLGNLGDEGEHDEEHTLTNGRDDDVEMVSIYVTISHHDVLLYYF